MIYISIFIFTIKFPCFVPRSSSLFFHRTRHDVRNDSSNVTGNALRRVLYEIGMRIVEDKGALDIVDADHVNIGQNGTRRIALFGHEGIDHAFRNLSAL